MELVNDMKFVFILLVLFSCKTESDNGLVLTIEHEQIKGCERNCDEVTILLQNKTKRDIILFQGEILSPIFYHYEIKNNVLVDSTQLPSWLMKLPPKEPPCWLNQRSIEPDTFIYKNSYPETNRLFKHVMEKYKKRNITNEEYNKARRDYLLTFFNTSIFLKKDSLFIKKFKYNFNFPINDSSMYKVKVSYFWDDENAGVNIIQDQLDFIRDTLKIVIPKQLDGYYIWLGKINAELTVPSH